MSTITKEKFIKVKNELKVEAKMLTDLKIEIKEKQRNGNAGNLQWKLINLKYNWRHKHIAYCLIKGRKLEEIEKYCHEHNKPNLNVIQMYINKWTTDAE